MKTLRLVLGDQLNSKHSWFQKVDGNIIYLMAEMQQETNYVKHHIQKVVAFFSAMRSFANTLEKKGHQVLYFKIGDRDNPQQLHSLISLCLTKTKASKFEYQLPDEYRLDEQLKEICSSLSIATKVYDTEHFYTTRYELKNFFEGKKLLLMESFYRMMRKKHDILMLNGQPEGGKWNFDQSNRKKWKGTPRVPEALSFTQDVSPIVEELQEKGIETFGYIANNALNWPTTYEESKKLTQYFCECLLPYFGDYQDAMHSEQKFLFHSRLSFAMNSKLISPKEVVSLVLDYYYDHGEDIHISQVEGFVRQILGWREYIRGIYWKEMPAYAKMNELQNYNPLPQFFWDANTKMNCLKKSIGQSLEEAYAHHIQRLMIIGNFALLAQLHPDEVDAWYLGVYIDAIEWVEMPNTRGMSQYADGGIVATKPYVSSANYIHKMGDYCTNCHYNKALKTGEQACPFNALYWNFLAEKKMHFKTNQRMGMMLNLLEKKDKAELKALQERAQSIIAAPDNF